MSHNEIYLRSKYGMDLPPDPDHPIVGTTQVVERTRALVTLDKGDTASLFDPNWNPKMWDVDQRTVHNMRQRFGDRVAASSDNDTFLYYPCIPELYVYEDEMERFSYKVTARVPLPHAVGRRGCDIQLAPDGCEGQAVYLPREHAPFIVVYGICRSCDRWARETSEIRFRSNVLAAQDQLPPGAQIDPGSPVSPSF